MLRFAPTYCNSSQGAGIWAARFDATIRNSGNALSRVRPNRNERYYTTRALQAIILKHNRSAAAFVTPSLRSTLPPKSIKEIPILPLPRGNPFNAPQLPKAGDAAPGFHPDRQGL